MDIGLVPLAPNPLSIDIWTFVFSALNVLVIVLVLYKFLFKPIGNIIEERQAFVENSLAEAKAQREEAERMLAEYSEQLKHAKDEARQIVQTATQEAEAYSSRRRAEAEQEAERMIERAKNEIETERLKALASIRDEVATLTIQAAERVIRREIRADDHSRMVHEMLQSVEERQAKEGGLQ